MLALIYGDEGKLTADERERPQPRAADVRVRVVGSGICGTDRNILLGRFPARRGVVMGHEAVGVVDAVGEGVHELAAGARVVVNPTLFCGLCEPCRRGRTGSCRNKAGIEVGVDRDGTFAEYVVLPERFVQAIPDDMAYARAVLIEPLACVLNNLMAARVGVGDTVLVIGAGPIGCLCALVAARLASHAALVERDPYRRRLSAELTGLAVFDANRTGASMGEVRERRPSIVIDTTGSALEPAIESVADGGTVVVMGFDNQARATVAPLRLATGGLRIVGAGDYDAPTFADAVRLASTLPLEHLITHVVPLEAPEEANALLGLGHAGPAAYGAMKVILQPPRTSDDWDATDETARAELLHA